MAQIDTFKTRTKLPVGGVLQYVLRQLAKS